MPKSLYRYFQTLILSNSLPHSVFCRKQHQQRQSVTSCGYLLPLCDNNLAYTSMTSDLFLTSGFRITRQCLLLPVDTLKGLSYHSVGLT